MGRSLGVSVIAVFALLGSALLFALAVLMLFAVLHFPTDKVGQVPGSPAAFRLVLFMIPVVYMLPSIWGFVSGVGLWKLKNWARISTIVFSVVLVLIGGFGGLSSLLIPFPAPARASDQSIMQAVRVFMFAFWLVLTGIGIWWLVFLNRPKVKMQFGAPFPNIYGTQPQSFSSMPDPVAGAAPQTSLRPLSITIIAWLLLLGSPCILIGLALRAPAILFTKVLTGGQGALFYLTFAAIQLAIGIGLLRLKPAARIAAILLFLFGLSNSFVFNFAPGGRARMLSLLNSEYSMFPWMRSIESQFAFDPVPSYMFGAVAGLVVAIIPIYFLIVRRSAFEAADVCVKPPDA